MWWLGKQKLVLVVLDTVIILELDIHCFKEWFTGVTLEIIFFSLVSHISLCSCFQDSTPECCSEQACGSLLRPSSGTTAPTDGG